MAAAAATKAAELSPSSRSATGREMSWWRVAVRGFRWSSVQSARRLKSIAAVRAQTMQSRTSVSSRSDGRPCVATRSAPSAKGSAKTVCENRIRPEEARKRSPFVRSNDNHRSSVSSRSRAAAKIGVPWAKSRRSNGQSSRRRSDRRMAFWSEQYFAGSRVNPYGRD